MGRIFLIFFMLVFGSATVLANNPDRGKQTIRDMFPEISSEEQLTAASGGVQYRFFVDLTARVVIKRLENAYKTGRKLDSGLVVSGRTRGRDGKLAFQFQDRAGVLVGSCRVIRHKLQTEILFFPPSLIMKMPSYKVFKIRPRLHLFPLRH